MTLSWAEQLSYKLYKWANYINVVTVLTSNSNCSKIIHPQAAWFSDLEHGRRVTHDAWCVKHLAIYNDLLRLIDSQSGRLKREVDEIDVWLSELARVQVRVAAWNVCWRHAACSPLIWWMGSPACYRRSVPCVFLMHLCLCACVGLVRINNSWNNIHKNG